MRGVAQKLLVVCACALLAAACSTTEETSSVIGGSYKVGQPYKEAGNWYYPRVQTDYDETGIASWYGPGFDGERTANGELFDADGLTAAHPTLPMPVNVRVTNLDNGRSLVLRVNDRGPFAQGRIIDVSAHAAQLLGFYEKGTAHVRVTYLARADSSGGDNTETPPAVATVAAVAAPTKQIQVASLEPVSVAPRQTVPAEADADETTPPQDPPPAMRPSELSDAPVAHFYVQAGAFAERDNAERLKGQLSSVGNSTISPVDRDGETLYRVRIGPFESANAAGEALANLSELGGSAAKIVVDQ
jgi:rare lipoprotein A